MAMYRAAQGSKKYCTNDNPTVWTNDQVKGCPKDNGWIESDNTRIRLSLTFGYYWNKMDCLIPMWTACG